MRLMSNVSALSLAVCPVSTALHPSCCASSPRHWYRHTRALASLAGGTSAVRRYSGRPQCRARAAQPQGNVSLLGQGVKGEISRFEA